MTTLKFVSMGLAAAVAVAVGAVWADETPDQRAMKLALSLANQAASQQPKTAVLARSSGPTAPAALAAGVTKATQGAKK